MRKLVDAKDLAQNTARQDRCGELVTISSDNLVTNAGLLKYYKSIEDVSTDLVYFTGFAAENDGGEGYYVRTDEDLEEDIGVVIKINGKTFKRKYSGEVRLEWFSTDYATSLKRAAKYSYIILLAGKEYPIRRQVELTLDRDLHINLNGATLRGYNSNKSTVIVTFKDKHISFTVTKGYIGDYANVGGAPLPTFFFLTNKAPTNKVDLHTLVIYLAPVDIETNQILTQGVLGEPISSSRWTIKGEKTFTQEVKGAQLGEVDPVRPNDLVTRDYLKKANLGTGLARIDKDATIQGVWFQGAVYVEPTVELDLEADLNRVLTPECTEAVAEIYFKNVVEPKLKQKQKILPCVVAEGGHYMQFTNGGPDEGYSLRNDPRAIWPYTEWKLYSYDKQLGDSGQTHMLLGLYGSTNTQKENDISKELYLVAAKEAAADRQCPSVGCRVWERLPLTFDIQQLRRDISFSVETAGSPDITISANTITLYQTTENGRSVTLEFYLIVTSYHYKLLSIAEGGDPLDKMLIKEERQGFASFTTKPRDSGAHGLTNLELYAEIKATPTAESSIMVKLGSYKVVVLPKSRVGFGTNLQLYPGFNKLVQNQSTALTLKVSIRPAESITVHRVEPEGEPGSTETSIYSTYLMLGVGNGAKLLAQRPVVASPRGVTLTGTALGQAVQGVTEEAYSITGGLVSGYTLSNARASIAVSNRPGVESMLYEETLEPTSPTYILLRPGESLFIGLMRSSTTRIRRGLYGPVPSSFDNRALGDKPIPPSPEADYWKPNFADDYVKPTSGPQALLMSFLFSEAQENDPLS